MPVIPATPWTANSTVSYADQSYQDGSRAAVAPVLSLPTFASVAANSVLLGCTTDEAGGTLYFYVSANASESAATIKASGSTDVSVTAGINTKTVTGLIASTAYYGHIVQVDSDTLDSNVVNTTQFTTAVAAAWQLPVGNYQPSLITMELIHPMPDAQTPVWAKHRRHPIGKEYRIPIGVKNGSWPFKYEIVTAPAGATIGETLSVSGSKLVVGAEYGVLTWPVTTVGNHSFSVLVTGQDGVAVSVVWNLEVTDTGIIYLDATSGNDTTGTGTEANPFKTPAGWDKDDWEDNTYKGFQVCYLNGDYAITSTDAVINNNIRLNYENKPLVHFAHEDAALVRFDFDNGNFSCTQTADGNDHTGEESFHDWFIGGIECIGGKQVDAARRWYLNGGEYGPFPFDGTGGGCRNTWFESPQKDWTYTGDAANNAGICFAANTFNAATGRSHFYVTRCDITNVTTSGAGATNFNGWFIGLMRNFLAEHNAITSTSFGRGPYSGKSSEWGSCYRNINLVAAPDQMFNYDNPGSYAPLVGGNNEVSYCKGLRVSAFNSDSVIISGHHGDAYNAGNTYHDPDYHFRNSFSGVGGSSPIIYPFADWPVYVYDDIWVTDDADGSYINTPENTQANGEWLLYATASNPFDANLDLTSATYLGTKGAEVAG